MPKMGTKNSALNCDEPSRLEYSDGREMKLSRDEKHGKGNGCSGRKDTDDSKKPKGKDGTEINRNQGTEDTKCISRYTSGAARSQIPKPKHSGINNNVVNYIMDMIYGHDTKQVHGNQGKEAEHSRKHGDGKQKYGHDTKQVHENQRQETEHSGKLGDGKQKYGHDTKQVHRDQRDNIFNPCSQKYGPKWHGYEPAKSRGLFKGYMEPADALDHYISDDKPLKKSTGLFRGGIELPTEMESKNDSSMKNTVRTNKLSKNKTVDNGGNNSTEETDPKVNSIGEADSSSRTPRLQWHKYNGKFYEKSARAQTSTGTHQQQNTVPSRGITLEKLKIDAVDYGKFTRSLDSPRPYVVDVSTPPSSGAEASMIPLPRQGSLNLNLQSRGITLEILNRDAVDYGKFTRSLDSPGPSVIDVSTPPSSGSEASKIPLRRQGSLNLSPPEQLAETEPVRYSDGSSHYKPYSRDNDVEVQNAKQKFHSSYCHQEVFDDASPITTVVHQSEQRRSRACQVDSNPSHYVPAEAAHSGMVFTTLQKGTSKTFKISDLDLPYVYFNYSLAPSDGKTVGCGQPLCDTKRLNSSQQSCDMCGIALQESKVSPEQTAEDWRRFEHNSSVLEDFINSKEEPMDTSEPAGGDPTPPNSFEMVLGPETLSSETDNGAKLFEDALRIDDQENVQPKGQPKCRPDKDMEPSISSRVIYDKNNEAWQVIDVGGDVVAQLGQSLMDCSTKL